MSKGSRARPLSIPKSKFDENWDAIFGKKSDTKPTKEDKDGRKQ